MPTPTTLVITLDAESLRVVALDDHGEKLGAASASYEMLSPQPGWLEQWPEDWWGALEKAVTAFEDGAPLTDVAEVRLSGELSGVVVLDGEADVIRPAMITGDERLPGGAASAMSWLRQHQTIAYKRVQHLLTPLSYMRYRLTSALAIDPADAETTGLFAAVAGSWSATKCDEAEINLDVLPHVSADGERAPIAADAALALGLRGDVVVR